jgi:uncharacterized protein YaiI (UPF0178 family)
VIHPGGKIYTDNNIDVMLMERDIARKCRRAGERIKNHVGKRTTADDDRFAGAFTKLCHKALEHESL